MWEAEDERLRPPSHTADVVEMALAEQVLSAVERSRSRYDCTLDGLDCEEARSLDKVGVPRSW